ncbi:helix-turn-helix domain-containing protein [Kitasatospora sp. NPDC056138]|uniref:helix-turn-helix domain-containing protein n=1 Tax=Kitasatospora sp. NPDC056138 TaxID=3345724 RepID=UPI0035D7805C
MFSSPAQHGALAVLELLATQAPPGELDELIRSARRSGASPETLERLDRARQLALRVHSLLDRHQQREAVLSSLVDSARDLAGPHEQDGLLEVVARRARLLLNLDISFISIHEPSDGTESVRAADGHSSTLLTGFEVERNAGVGALAHAASAPFWTPDYLADERFPHTERLDRLIRTEGVRTLLAVPLRHGNEAFGTLYAGARSIRHLRPDEVSLMSSLTDLAAGALDRTRLISRVQAEVAELARDSTRARSGLSTVRRAADAHRRLIELVLTGCDLPTLTAEAARVLDGSLAVTGSCGEEFATAGDPLDLDRRTLIETYLDAHTSLDPFALADGTWVAPAVAGSESLALLLLRPRTPPDEHGVRLLRLAAQAVSLQLVLLHSAAIAEGPVRDELLDDLLAEPPRPESQLQVRAQRLGLDLDQPHILVIARPEGGALGRAVIWASSYAGRTGGLKSVRDGCLVLLLPGTDAAGTARAVCDELAPLIGHPVTAGAAGPGRGPASSTRLHREAQRCLEALTALGGTGGSAATEDLGFLGVLLSDSQDIGGFVTGVLGPVLEYDRQRFTELTRTLDAYFDSGGSPTYAAEALHVHPNTVSRRLERIAELLGPDWQKPAQALEIQLALRLHRTRRALGNQ